jgi:hypothetical protein
MTLFSARTNPDYNAARLVIGGEQIDCRTREARRFKAVLSDLAEQMGREPTASERLQLISAATLSLLIERDTLKLLRGELHEEEPFRRNTTALRAALTTLGLAMKSRDVKKADLHQGQSILAQLIEE